MNYITNAFSSLFTTPTVENEQTERNGCRRITNFFLGFFSNSDKEVNEQPSKREVQKVSKDSPKPPKKSDKVISKPSSKREVKNSPKQLSRNPVEMTLDVNGWTLDMTLWDKDSRKFILEVLEIHRKFNKIHMITPISLLRQLIETPHLKCDKAIKSLLNQISKTNKEECGELLLQDAMLKRNIHAVKGFLGTGIKLKDQEFIESFKQVLSLSGDFKIRNSPSSTIYAYLEMFSD